MDDKNLNKESQMSSEEMFDSWTKQIMGDEGTTNNNPKPLPQSNNELSNPFAEINQQSDDVSNKPQPFDSRTNEIPSNMTFQSPSIEKPDSVTNNIPQPQTNKFSNAFDIPDKKKYSQGMEEAFSDDNKNAIMSLLFIVIIIAGLGYFIFAFKDDDKLEEPNIVNKNDDINNEEKVEPIEEDKKEPEEKDKTDVNNVNTSATEELKRLCNLVDAKGDYYNEMTGDVNDINYVVENARYCTGNLCLYTENNIVYSRNCSSGLEVKMTVDEMKVSTSLGFACVEYNKSGNYSDPTLGISCKDKHCSATVNGRRFDQNCDKFKGM